MSARGAFECFSAQTVWNLSSYLKGWWSQGAFKHSFDSPFAAYYTTIFCCARTAVSFPAFWPIVRPVVDHHLPMPLFHRPSPPSKSRSSPISKSSYISRPKQCSISCLLSGLRSVVVQLPKQLSVFRALSPEAVLRPTLSGLRSVVDHLLKQLSVSHPLSRSRLASYVLEVEVGR